MSATSSVTIYCDHVSGVGWCDAKVATGERTATLARNITRAAGWSTRAGSDYCPRHKAAHER